jgi:Domain of unknown function (DU1801)
MAELKTKQTNASVSAFLDTIEDEDVREDCRAIADIMAKATKAPPRMWGASIVGFGTYHYKYPSGREADWMLVAFSPRKQNITLYIMPGFKEYGDLRSKLGPHASGKACLHIKRLSDVHVPTLKKLVKRSVDHMRKTYGA